MDRLRTQPLCIVLAMIAVASGLTTSTGCSLMATAMYVPSLAINAASGGRVDLNTMTIIVGVIDRGRLISPAYSRLDKRNLAKLRNVRYERARLEPVTTEGGAD